MNRLKQLIDSRIVQRDIREKTIYRTSALVEESDPDNNICSINFLNSKGQYTNLRHVGVMIYGNGTDWFPKKGEEVVVEVTGKSAVIIARHVTNYKAQIYSDRNLRQDILSDSGGCAPGGSICG